MKEWRLKKGNLHSQNVCKIVSLEERKNNPNFIQVQRERKHRYILFRGNKREKRKRLSALKYPLGNYPKGKSQTYSCIDIKETQSRLVSNSSP